MIRLFLAALAFAGLTWATPAQADDCGLTGCQPGPWNGQLMPTWNTPGFYGGWTNTPVICNQFTYRCGGYADQPNG